MSLATDDTGFPHDHDQNSDSGADAEGALGECLVCAGAFELSAGPPADPEERIGAESQSLLHWAEDTGRVLSATELNGLIEGFKMLEGGLEHHVYYVRKSGRVYKVTKAGRFGYAWYLKDYLQNLVWSNRAFGDDVRLEGVTSKAGGVSVVISQSYIHGKKPSMQEIAEWFAGQGCKRLGELRWEYPDGMVVGDAHTGNIILMADGSMVPIDLRIEKPGLGFGRPGTVAGGRR